MNRQSAATRWTAIACVILLCILGPYFAFGEALEAWSIATLRNANTSLKTALIATLLAADVFLPIPSSIVSTLGGTFLGVVKGTIASTAGMTIGALLGYVVGRVFRKSLAPRFLSAKSRERAEALAAQKGLWGIAFARPIPVLAEASVIVAGINSVPVVPFTLVTTLSNLGISLVYAAAGARSFTGSFAWAVAAAIGLPGIAIAVNTAIERRNKEKY